MTDYVNTFARDLSESRGLTRDLANAYAKAFRAADTAEKRQIVIDSLSLSHALKGMAIYGERVERKELS